ncbi:hypothetical protein ACTG4Q_20950 [Bradyrhizobium denitrificans]
MSDDRKVLSPAALRITDGEHRALREIRDLFANGVFKHDPHADVDKPDGFSMDAAIRETRCGTTCCIGGWMWHAMDRDRTTQSASATRYVHWEKSQALHALFFPDFDDIDDMAYSDVTPGAALLAIDSFLATGDPDWHRACGLHLAEELPA